MTNSSPNSFLLESYGYDLTQLARDWRLPHLKGYEEWVARIFSILLRKEKMNRSYNPVLIDSDETRRWHVVMEVLRCLITGETPDPLRSLRVIAPNFAALCGAPHTVQQDITGTALSVEERLVQLLSWPYFETWSTPDEILPRLEAFFSVACQTENQVLLINDFHRLVGGEPQPYIINMQNLLVPALARRQIQLIGICNLVLFRQYIERDGAIMRRMQPVML